MTSLKAWIKQSNAKKPSMNGPGGGAPSANSGVSAGAASKMSPKMIKRYGAKTVRRAGDPGNAGSS